METGSGSWKHVKMGSDVCKCLKMTKNKWWRLENAYGGLRMHVGFERCALGLENVCRGSRTVEKG
jgi:hypothetical protein